MLAVMKIGSTYVPVDPSYPADYKRFLAEDAEARVVICQHGDTAFGAKSLVLPCPAILDSTPIQLTMQRYFLSIGCELVYALLAVPMPRKFSTSCTQVAAQVFLKVSTVPMLKPSIASDGCGRHGENTQ